MLTEICGCLAKMFFHVFSKEGRIGETEQIAYLFDAIISLFQVIADVLEYMFRNPFVGGLARVFLAKRREVFGRDAEFVGIPFHRSVFHFCGVQQVEEVLKMIIVCLRIY